MNSAAAASGFIVTSLALAAAAIAAPHPTMTAHVPPQATAGNRIAALPAGQVFRLAITLPLHNQPILDRLLQEQQDPRSASYRRYLSVAEFTSRFGPTAAEYAALRQFTAAHGMRILAESPNRFTLDVAATAGTIADSFGVHIGLYRDPAGTRVFYAPDREPMIDTPMPVLHIAGLDNFASPVPHAVIHAGHGIQQVGSGPNGDYTGADIRTAYAGGTSLTGAGQIVGLIEFLPYNSTNIQTYFANIGKPNSVPIVGISVDGTAVTCSGTCGGNDLEPSIDLEQVMSMAPGLKQVSFYIGSTVIDILNRIASDNTAKEISSSYGWPAANEEETPVYKEFAAQGQSFVDGTGDEGPNLAQGGVWPADDAWVTAVGATNLTTENGMWQSETGWQNSGGGPSPDKIKLPRWQKNFVNGQNLASATLRNVPDVAIEGAYDSYVCFQLDCYGGYGGTSFAAPRWAALLALVNQQAMESKGTTVGFLNPKLYKLAGGANYGSNLHDITSGYNGQYYAVSSLDLVTGIGSPQPALIDTLASGAN